MKVFQDQSNPKLQKTVTTSTHGLMWSYEGRKHQWKALAERENVRLPVADSHTGNHLEDDFTSLKTIRRSYSVIKEKIPLELKGRPSSQRGEEFNDFLALYPIPSEYHVILPKSNQTVFDAPPGYVGLYIHSFSLANLRLPLTEFFCEVLEYYQINFLPILKRIPCSNVLIDIPQVYPILFLAGLKPSWEHEIAFRNFIYTKDNEDLAFLPNPGFGTGSPSILVNTEPLKANEEPEIQPAEVTTDSRGSPKPDLFVVHPGSVAAQIKDRKCKTRGGSSRPPVKRKIASGSSTSRGTRAKTSSLKDDAPFLTVSNDDEGLPDVLDLKDANDGHLKISAITPPAWKNHLDNHMDLELLDLHDHCYARQVVVDNVVNRRSHELLYVIEKLRGECDVMRSRERARDEECEGLWVKCEAAMTEFEKNPVMVAFREKISVLSTEVKEHKLNLDRMMLESDERIKELELRVQRRNNFEEELFKDRFPTEKKLAYHKELLGEPQSPFSTLEPKIRKGDPKSLKIPYVIGTVYTSHAYIDLQSLVNIMSRAYHNKIREKSFQACRNPYQPYKFCNFVGRAKNVHIFIGCFVYVVDFIILEDLGSIIDSGLSEVVLGQPFTHTSKVAYDESLGLIRYTAYGVVKLLVEVPYDNRNNQQPNAMYRPSLGHGSSQGLGVNQDYFMSQDYSMGHSLAHGLDNSSDPVEDDSLVEEVAPIKAKKVSKRLQKAKTIDNLESSKPWTTMEEVTLCKAWCDTRGYNAIPNKWKNRVRPRIGAFCAIINNVERRNESVSRDLTVFQKALAEYEALYDHEFTLEPCWRILKDHAAWKEFEMSLFYKKQYKGSKKAKTFKSTSGLTHGGFNLNE
ncbi:hypothetical protein Tco_0268103 [Tanacetum coccineum]